MAMNSDGSATFNITGELVTALRTLAERNGTSVTTELRLAVSDRKFFSDKVESGSTISLEHADTPHERTLVEFR